MQATWLTAIAVAVGLHGVAGAAAQPAALPQPVSPTAVPSAPPVPAPAPVPAALPGLPAPGPLAAGVIAPGVTIDGVDVAGLTRVPAMRKVLLERVLPKRRPLVATFRGRRIGIDPVTAGYVADVRYAVRAALAFGRTHKIRPSVDVPLPEKVNRRRIRTILKEHARRLDIPPRDAALTFRGATPVFTKPRIGKRIDLAAAERLLVDAMLDRSGNAIALPARRLRPAVESPPPAILIERSKFRLTLFWEGRRKGFDIAVGQPAHPTPTGSYTLVTKQVDPTWFPPDSPWAAGLGPVPPGVNNPLGTRWMGTSAPAIGIHGTPLSDTIGTAASYGCIRMRIPEAEYLYDRVAIGTPVVIV